MIVKEQNNSLEGFEGWANIAPEIDFFSQQDTEQELGTDAKSVIKKLSQDEVVEVNEEKEKKKETLQENKDEKNLFDVEENEGEDPDGEGEDLKVELGSNVSVLNTLKEKGLLDYELEEGEELTEELAEELIEEKFEESVDNKVKELLTELPELAQQLIQFTLKGGNPVEFIHSLTSNEVSLKPDINLEKEENQILVMKQLLKLEDKDDEEIETEIEFLKDSGKLKTISEKKFNKFKLEAENRQKELLKEQEKTKEEEKKQIKQAKVKISNFLNESQELNGVSFSKEDKKELPSYMNDRTVKLQNGTVITQMQKELFYDLPRNEKALIQLATLLKNRNDDGTFNFDSIVKSTKTKVTQEVRQEIRRNKSSIPGSLTSKSNEANKSLAEYFTKN